MMKKEELQHFFNEIKTNSKSSDIIDEAIGGLSLDPASIAKLVLHIAETPVIIRDSIYWNKFWMFITGVKIIEEELGESIRLSHKLFDTLENRKKNGMRLLGYIEKADSQDKITYYVNATRSLLIGNIDTTDYFRIFKAVTETLSEDLEYLVRIAVNSIAIKGNTQILALERSGLMIQAGIDANEAVEAQSYIVTTFGRMVDQYALSLNSDDRQQFYSSYKKS